MNRALEIKKIILEYAEIAPIEEWADGLWEDVEECINGIYFEEWKDLIDSTLVLKVKADYPDLAGWLFALRDDKFDEVEVLRRLGI